jgi:coenzyme F420-0:L-glutamate ligase/coenzyme F420-1:gamma-L-glutamate ligase
LISSRRSIRKFTSSNVEPRVVNRVLVTATWAPSAHNSQPWRFVLVERGEIRTKLVDEMARLFEKDLAADGLSAELNRVAISKERLLKAPVLVLVCLTMEGMRRYTDDRRMEAEYLMAVQSVAASIQNLLLAAHVEGLGSCWMGAPLFCRETIKTTLELPKSFDPQAFVLIGSPDEKPDPPVRKSLEEVVLRK